ncbi:hypothetical protein REC12_11575 [Desulfosporosinus sp. PR]|uniref:hypothetical protein n=1 Tax=Candidatus Desulfosporosinus nitrosoreducens TaxID=3401928 RepID=UPI0027EABEAF|nr:hypothetical protein [Desulfosporosinus sp. PR]MDQ7094229.1 hypothetical protein [Desulfosporosinus sp. PR]
MAGSTNFLVFNPTDTSNTDTDIEYLAETQRTSGLQNGIAKTRMHNKFYRQTSVMVAALAQFMANQGQTVSDDNVNALVTAITNTFDVSGSNLLKASVSEVSITGTSQQTIATYTPPARGNYQIDCYFRVVTAPTMVTITVTYTDATGAQTNTMISQMVPVGSYNLVPLIINANAAAISVNVTAGIANQVYISSSILGV